MRAREIFGAGTGTMLVVTLLGAALFGAPPGSDAKLKLSAIRSIKVEFFRQFSKLSNVRNTTKKRQLNIKCLVGRNREEWVKRSK